MTAPSHAERFSPEFRAALYHFTVFGTAGVASVYFGIWLANRGIPADQIGILNAAPVLAMLLINQLVGRLADRAKDWRSVILLLSVISAAGAVGLFFVSGFWGILTVYVLTVMPAFALVPIVDAATLRMTERRGTNFSTVRAWGTVGFMVTSFVSGPLIAWLGDAAFAPLFVAFAVARALFGLQLPQFRGEKSAAASKSPQAGASRLKQVIRPWFVLTLLGVALLYASHNVIGAFAALLWREQGIPEALVGPLVAVMAGAEAVMMFAWTRLKLKVSARHIIIFASLVAALRWGIMAFSPPIWLLFALQMLHSVTFAMGYMGGIYFIANWTSEEIAAEAQGFSYLLQQGAGVLTLIGLGWLISLFGAHALLVVSAACLLGAGLVLLSLKLQPAHQHPGSIDAVANRAAANPDGAMP